MSSTILEQLENEINKEDNAKAQITASMSSSSNTSNNETKSIKNKFAALLYSNKLIEGEKEAKKEVFKALKDEHGIPPKVAKKVEKLLDKGSITEFEEEWNAIEQLYEKVRS